MNPSSQQNSGIVDQTELNSKWHKLLHPTLSVTYVVIFLIGISCMTVAGYFLIEGLSEFSGSGGAKRMLIVGGILFQVTESICFIAAASLTAHSMRWRYILFSLGVVLFCFSIGVMTLAQKTALQSGEAQAQAIDEKREYLRKQIASLDRVIASYRVNAEKQSKSIFKDSRALGQDSLNRATDLEEKKLSLSQQLFLLNQQRRQTSSDFFKRFEEISGLPANQTEFYFLVLRSLLLELCGIILMSFSANLRAYNLLISKLSVLPMDIKNEKQSAPAAEETTAETAPVAQAEKNEVSETDKTLMPTDQPASEIVQTALHHGEAGLYSAPKPYMESDFPEEEESVAELDEDWDHHWASPKLRARKLKNAGISETELQILSSQVTDLHEQGIIRGNSPATIRRNLKDHCRKTINNEVATILSRILKSRQEA